MAVNSTLVLVGSSAAFWAVATLVASAGIGLAIAVYKKCKNMFKPPPGSNARQTLPAVQVAEMLRETENINLSTKAIREKLIRQQQLLEVREEVRQQHEEEECSEGGSTSTQTKPRE